MFATLATCSSKPAQEPKPNIIYIMLDEMGYYEPSYMGNKMLETTNIDKMAKEGIFFTTEEGTLYAVDFEGNSIWKTPIGGNIYTGPVAAGEFILVAPIDSDTSMRLVALNLNGTERWSFTTAEEQ